MEKVYESVVKEWYMSLRNPLMESIIRKFPNLSEEDAMNIYIDIFINIRKNLYDGIISKHTDWKEYIITEGMKIACEQSGNDNNENTAANTYLSVELLKQLTIIENEPDIYENPITQNILSYELNNTPEPYQTLIIFKYFYNLTDEEIVNNYIDGESSEQNSEMIKQLISSGIDDLSYRVKRAVSAAGIID